MLLFLCWKPRMCNNIPLRFKPHWTYHNTFFFLKKAFFSIVIWWVYYLLFYGLTFVQVFLYISMIISNRVWIWLWFTHLNVCTVEWDVTCNLHFLFKLKDEDENEKKSLVFFSSSFVKVLSNSFKHNAELRRTAPGANTWTWIL